MPGPDDRERYRRQEILPEVGAAGQRRVRGSSVAVVGCGALGTVAAELLVRAGVGRMTLVDRDVVEMTNLHRQTLFDEADAAAGAPKAEAARVRLGAINTGVPVAARVADIIPSTAETLLGFGTGGAPDLIIDGTDNFETRFLLNDVAVKHGVPLIYGGGIGTSGAVGVFAFEGGPCLRCAFDGPPAPGSQPTCESAGVLGPVTAVVGARQAGAALRTIVDPPRPGPGALERFDLWTGEHRCVRLEPDPACPCCAAHRFEYLEAEGDPAVSMLCGRDAVQIPASGEVDLEALARRLAPAGRFTVGPFMLRGDVEGGRYQLTVFGDGRTVVRGTRDLAEARSVHARYVGG